MHTDENNSIPDTLVDRFRHIMGWCPNTQSHRFCRSVAPDPSAPAVSGGGGAPALAFGPLNRYRTRALLFALCMTGVGFTLFTMATGDRLAMLGIGLVIATLLWLSDAFNYWNLFRDVEREGIADEKDWKEITVVRTLPIAGVALILGFAGIVLLGLVPGLSMLMVNGFLAAFGVIGWYHVATILVWERRSGITLFSDGTRIYRRA